MCVIKILQDVSVRVELVQHVSVVLTVVNRVHQILQSKDNN